VTQPPLSDGRLPLIRALLFVAVALWMLSGPVYRQVFGGESQYIREWRMYGTRAVRTCKVLYEQETDGVWTPVSRWETEGFTFSTFPGRGRRMLDKRKDAEKAGRALCRTLGEDTVLRYRRRCGHVRRGWGKWELSEDLCRPEPGR